MLVLFALGLMSKPMVVTLPAALLVVDFWPLERFTTGGPALRRAVVEKLPLLALSGVSAVVTVLAQRGAGALPGTVDTCPTPGGSCSHAARAGCCNVDADCASGDHCSSHACVANNTSHGSPHGSCTQTTPPAALGALGLLALLWRRRRR